MFLGGRRIVAEGCRGDIYGGQQPAKRSCSPLPTLRYTDLDPDLAALEWLRIATDAGRQPRFAGCLASYMPPLQPSACLSQHCDAPPNISMVIDEHLYIRYSQ
jgi:hypothetical protein